MEKYKSKLKSELAQAAGVSLPISAVPLLCSNFVVGCQVRTFLGIVLLPKGFFVPIFRKAHSAYICVGELCQECFQSIRESGVRIDF